MKPKTTTQTKCQLNQKMKIIFSWMAHIPFGVGGIKVFGKWDMGNLFYSIDNNGDIH